MKNKIILLSTLIFILSIKISNCQNCDSIIDPVVICNHGNYTLQFSIKNTTNWTQKGLTIANLDPNISVVSTLHNGSAPFINIPNIAPGAISSVITLPLYVPVYNKIACFSLTFCSVDSPSQFSFPHNCCTLDTVCVAIPNCQGIGNSSTGFPCDSLTNITYKHSDTTGSCCYNLSLINNYLAANLKTISFTGIGGTQFNVTTTSGWTYTGVSSTTYRELTAPPGGYGTGVYADFFKLCITSSGLPPYKIVVNYTDVNNFYLCTDTIVFDTCKIIPDTCVAIVNDSIYCDKGKTMIQFDIINKSPYPIMQMDYWVPDTAHFVIKPNTIQFTSATAIAVGATAGHFTTEIDTINGGKSNFCFQVSAFNKAYTQNSYATKCCSDSIHQICLPFLDCKLNGCCDFDHMIIPNGITPNGDGINDKLVIVKPAMCDSIKLTVFNRWGNKVYEDANYMNTWGGTNQSGALLSQSTYFMVIELKNGSKKGLYVDVRY